MSWKKVGEFIQEKGGSLLKLAGAVATGNVPGGIAAVASLVTQATGETEPDKALAVLQTNPEAMIALQRLLKENEADIRKHHRDMMQMEFEDEQLRHKETQTTVREGDKSSDEFVRRTRPMMARQSWQATVAYCLASGVAKGFGVDIFVFEVAAVLSAPAWAYIGLRTVDGFSRKGK